eukprot:365262-Chlamydomonas_euryale.AAC.9
MPGQCLSQRTPPPPSFLFPARTCSMPGQCLPQRTSRIAASAASVDWVPERAESHAPSANCTSARSTHGKRCAQSCVVWGREQV